MSYKYVLSMLALIVTPALAYAGTETGNGGDVVWCRAIPGSEYSGYYTLDFLTARVQGMGKRDFVAVSSLKQSMDRIEKLLSEKNRSLGVAFKTFRYYTSNTTDSTQSRVWVPSEYGLEDVKDERILVKFPANCYRRGTKTLDIHQLITRRLVGEQILYFYDKAILAKIGEDPLQVSMGYFHEFLWDLTSDIEAVRRFNVLVHTRRFEKMSADEFLDFINSIGLGKGHEEYIGDDAEWRLNYELERSVIENNLVKAKSFLEQGADPNHTVVEDSSNTLLHIAVKSENIDLARLLISKGATAEKTNRDLQTPLFFAVSRNMIQLLIDNGCLVNSRDTRGQTPLHRAVVQGQTDVVDALLSFGADAAIRDDQGLTPLLAVLSSLFDGNRTRSEVRTALLNGSPQFSIIPRLIAMAGDGLNQKIYVRLSPKDQYLRTLLPVSVSPLTLMLFIGNGDLVNRLIEKNVDVNAPDGFSYQEYVNYSSVSGSFTPLFTAVGVLDDNLARDIAEKILNLGAAINASGTGGFTPLMNATVSNSIQTVKYLLARGANVNAQDSSGKTSLSIAVERGFKELEQVLRDAGGKK